jgi:hypothetical protein
VSRKKGEEGLPMGHPCGQFQCFQHVKTLKNGFICRFSWEIKESFDGGSAVLKDNTAGG